MASRFLEEVRQIRGRLLASSLTRHYIVTPFTGVHARAQEFTPGPFGGVRGGGGQVGLVQVRAGGYYSVG